MLFSQLVSGGGGVPACAVLLLFRLHVAIAFLNAQNVVLRLLHASARGCISISEVGSKEE